MILDIMYSLVLGYITTAIFLIFLTFDLFFFSDEFARVLYRLTGLFVSGMFYAWLFA